MVAYEDDVDIPLPKSEKLYSGKFVLRIPRSLHRTIDELAQEEGVSLNSLLIQLVSESLGNHENSRHLYKTRPERIIQYIIRENQES